MADPIDVFPPTASDAEAAVLDLLRSRTPHATVCPSEAARVLAHADPTTVGWRALMPIIHDAVDRLFADGAIEPSWKGPALPARRGPYRIGRAATPGRSSSRD